MTVIGRIDGIPVVTRETALAHASGIVVNTGVNDARAALAAVDAIGPHCLPIGTYRVASNLTLNNTVEIQPGAKLKPDSGVTITLMVAPIAGAYQWIDESAGGFVRFGVGALRAAPLQWWGGKVDGVTDDSTAYSRSIACMNASGGGDVLLTGRAATSTTVSLLSNVLVRGDTGKRWSFGANGAAIVAKSGVTGPLVSVAGADINTRVLNAGLSDLELDCQATTGGINSPAIYLQHATAYLPFHNLKINRPTGGAFFLDGDVFFVRADRCYIEQSSAGYAGAVIIKGTGQGQGTSPFTNGNHFTNFTYTGNTSNDGVRVIEIVSEPGAGNTHNLFADWDVQSVRARMDDAVFYISGGWNVFRNVKNYDQVNYSRTITATASGTGSVIRCTCANHGLRTGQKVTVTGITGASGLLTVTNIDAVHFELQGTTFSGSSQTGSWARGGSISATASGQSNEIRITSTDHRLRTGQLVTITGITGATPGTQYRAVLIDGNTFDLLGTTYSGTPEAGTWGINDITSDVHLSQVVANGNVFERFFGSNWLLSDSAIFRFSAGATGNLISEVDYAGGGAGAGQPLYHCDSTSTSNEIRILRQDTGVCVVRDTDMHPTSSRIARISVLDGGYVKMANLHSWFGGNGNGAQLSAADLFLGEYALINHSTGADRNSGYPMRPRLDTRQDQVLTGNQVVSTAQSSSSITPIFMGAVHGGSDSVATNNTECPTVLRGMVRLVDLDASAAAVGDPIYISSTGSYTLTAPTTGYCILAGWVTSITNPAYAFIHFNYLSEYARRSRLGMQRFTTDPTLAQMKSEEVAVGVVGGVGKLYYKSGATIYVFTHAATIIV